MNRSTSAALVILFVILALPVNALAESLLVDAGSPGERGPGCIVDTANGFAKGYPARSTR